MINSALRGAARMSIVRQQFAKKKAASAQEVAQKAYEVGRAWNRLTLADLFYIV
jgi:hypothetical protein